MEREKILKVKDLELVLEKTDILKGLNFELQAGEVLGIIGPNGCGKSSLAYTLMGLDGYKPAGGRVIFKGVDITDLKPYERAWEGLTLAWQEPARFEGISVREFLALGRKHRESEVGSGEIRRALQDVAINPDQYLDRSIDETLSGGERKRIELASILLMNPDAVILDEPDSGVDVVALNNIEEVINNFRENNTGVILITHSEEMLEMADRAALICQGKIFMENSPAKISSYFKDECLPCEDQDPAKHKEVS
ncbi:ABC transporter ATP-binding protein [Halarsenatibacter silvermanii]|uniref:Iron-regulated ABC transporter ATPase subunit SufC n=1 Tax=Halarsenatibacter silvermanii TaxID=321763 RepID=A0A1G9IVF2_9FIRM|nr:ABC transporter ATP-binding protein [Halarsenatibacter silvermanii]SDL28913.1 Iron-regulated ABC transporter ATPase subunit SufC [Halarsenatibacter silvermanii]